VSLRIRFKGGGGRRRKEEDEEEGGGGRGLEFRKRGRGREEVKAP